MKKRSASLSPLSTLRNNRALLDAFRRGDRDALERVYWAYVDAVTAAVRYGLITPAGKRVPGVHTDDVSDAVQEVFMKAFAERARLAYDGVRDYQPYVTRIARNLVVDRARKRGREVPDSGELASAVVAPAPDEQPEYMDPDLVLVVQEFVGSLSAPLRAVYEQRYELDRSQVETADKLGISRQRVRTIEKRLRTGLKKAIGKHERSQ